MISAKASGKVHWRSAFSSGSPLGGQLQHVAAGFAADGEVGNQDFAGGHEEAAAAEDVEDGLPAFVEARDAVELHVVDVHVGVQLVRVVDREDIDFAGHVFPLAPVGHVVQQVEHALAELFARQVAGHRLPRAAEPEVGEEEVFVAKEVGRPG